jgi:hypothetical protein
MGASPEEMDGGTWCPAAGLNRVMSLVWEVKGFLIKRNGARFGVDAEVLPQNA